MQNKKFSLKPSLIANQEQLSIIFSKGNCVVIAQPGSGKTFVLSQKIKLELQELPDFKGVVAISFTNNASNELEKRCLNSYTDKKGSFFGTIDTFFLHEIILPFGKQLFGMPQHKIKVISNIEDDKLSSDIDLVLRNGYDKLNTDDIIKIKEHFLSGMIFLKTFGILALYVIDNSLACRKYLKARYSHIIIDEYQDSGYEQHACFLKMMDLGLSAIAVGDINQSIYAFSGKESKYLYHLTQMEEKFKLFALSVNFRCHRSIIDYSDKILQPGYNPSILDDIRVFEKSIRGSEIEIAKWLNVAIPALMNTYKISKPNKVAILVKSNRTGKIIDNNLSLKHKLFDRTPLDEDTSYWGIIFKKILLLIFNTDATIYNFIADYFDIEGETIKTRNLYYLLENIIKGGRKNLFILKNKLEDFVNIAKIIYPKEKNPESIHSLVKILDSEEQLNAFKPAGTDEVQIMTLHKSKGLEFDIVFHLDLYRYILPTERNGQYFNYKQDLNLFYVGVTRAKECCVLCTSTKRHRGTDGNITSAERSIFMEMNNLDAYRKVLDL